MDLNRTVSVVSFTVGGIIGFSKSGSSKSLFAGGGSASILYYVFLNLPSNPVLASAIGLGKSTALATNVFSKRHRNPKTLNPKLKTATVQSLGSF